MSPLRVLCVKGDHGTCKCMFPRQLYTRLWREVYLGVVSVLAVEITGLVCAGACTSTKESSPYGRNDHWSPEESRHAT